ncbi:glycoside hydrolase family 13 protein [Ancylomarina longa]|uniref:Alpha-amlyase n=1 Tax=Ancylomarina longa TaxID=2487017 RepID=A0A434AZ00_9BACT|nr:glycoside hydrolase family 13 protein [Ancylomarina longa]RUT79820.1 alpha-amlyase [Ancylomarina longa]
MKLKWRYLSLLVIFLMGGFGAIASKAPERVEPAFWWIGMKNPNLQLMIYGKDISDYQPVVDYPGVSIERVISVKSPNYLFMNLRIAADAKSGAFDIKFQKNGKTVLTYVYKLLQREKGSADRQGYNASDAIYLITPDRFVNGNPKNDTVEGLLEKANRMDKNGRHGGDIQGIINSLDYIKEMGFTTIWINPLLENNQPVFSYHGYSTTNYYKIDARFGTNEEYRELAEIASKKGIKLIMDMIENHCGSGHWWVKDLPTDDWFNFQGDYHPTIHHRETIQDPYASDFDKKLHSDGWFVKSMPDLNQKNDLMATYLIQNAIWWIEYAHLGGIRQDTYPYPDKDFMSNWSKAIMTEYPHFNMVGEEWSTNPSIVAFWQRGKQNPNGYKSYLPGLMDFPLQNALVESLNGDENIYGHGIVKLYSTLANDFVYADPMNLVVFPDNHDMSRFFTQINEDFDLYKMGITYIAVTRGIPQIYYGTEILMKNPGTTDHGIIRSDFPGGWKGDQVNAFTGAGLSNQQKEAQQLVKKLFNWRKGCEAVHTGKLKHFAPIYNNSIYTLFRYTDKQIVMLIMNKNAEAKTIALDKFRAEVIGDASEGRNVLSGAKVILKDSVKVAGRSALLIEIDK